MKTALLSNSLFLNNCEIQSPFLTWQRLREERALIPEIRTSLEADVTQAPRSLPGDVRKETVSFTRMI